MTLRRHSPVIVVGPLLWLLAGTLLGCAAPQPTPTQVPVATRTLKPTFTLVATRTLHPTATAAPTHTATLPATAIPPSPTVAVAPTATPDPLLNPLTALRADDPSYLSRRVLAVRVGNDPLIRPQDGLGQADIVYEELMEGNVVTRYTALYLGRDAERIRPIRSARLVSLAIAPQYDAALVHSGASDKIRWLIAQASFVDLDQFYHAEPHSVLAGYDWRGRMYTSVEAVHGYLRRKGLERETPIAGYAFDAAPPPGAPASSIRIPYPEEVVWAYDSAMGTYRRQISGQVHTDGLTGEPIRAANVIVFYAEHRKTDIVEDSLGSTAIDIVMAGEGRAQMCRDGVMVETRWRADGPQGLIQYFDDGGRLVPLRPGQTWIQIVPTEYQVVVGR